MPNLFDLPARACVARCSNSAKQLNQTCYCTTLDRDLLLQKLTNENNQKDLLLSHPLLFSETAVFISEAQRTAMQGLIAAVERVTQSAPYRNEVMARAPAEAQLNPGTAGVFMGYDFHLGEDGPALIEINTNAGGGFLNAVLIGAQTACCQAHLNQSIPVQKDVEQQFLKMFLDEWQQQKLSTPLKSIAIVDDNPEQQFLYPEFQLAKQLFEKIGVRAVIANAADLQIANGKLTYNGAPLDLIYNRLTDFYLSEPNHQVLHQAYLSNLAVVTPGPHQYTLYADKRNLVTLSDDNIMKSCGLSADELRAIRKTVPPTFLVTKENADDLWQKRADLFFKPISGFGSRGAYRGNKITKRVWSEIQSGCYIAQQLVTPSNRGILLDKQEVLLKTDIRAYAYKGQIQLLAARLYQGQTTNFRTQGGGFAPVFVIPQ